MGRIDEFEKLKEENEKLRNSYMELLNDYKNLKSRSAESENVGHEKGCAESFDIVSRIMNTVKYGIIEKPIMAMYDVLKKVVSDFGYTVIDEKWLYANTNMCFDDRYCNAVAVTHSLSNVHNRMKVISKVCEDGFIDRNGKVLKYAKVIVNS